MVKEKILYWSHVKEIREVYGLTLFNDNHKKDVEEFLINLALENDNNFFMIDRCIDFLRTNKVILPAITTIESLVWESKKKSEDIVINTIISNLNQEQREYLSKIISSQSEKLKNTTILGWLKEPIGRPSVDNFIKVIDKLEYIRELKLESIELNKLHSNKINQMYRLGQRYEPKAFRQFNDDKSHAILSIFLLNLSKDLTDKAFEIHDRILQMMMTSAKKLKKKCKDRMEKR